MEKEYLLKTEACINALLKDLYIDLRAKVVFWSSLTDQTAQARMGYIGQHLVSAVTGFKGGKSGARGRDLIISETEYAEIKTCSRVDQLGMCKRCGSPVSPNEVCCSSCGSEEIERKDDSKWLISITEEYPSTSALEESEDILVNINKPKFFYFVLFEFEDIKIATSSIVVTIYRVNPRVPGFTLCMLDYFYNIKKNAPFNMWPHMLKFNLCDPEIIYQSIIDVNGDIRTIIFDNEKPTKEPFDNLAQYNRSKNLTDTTLRNLCEAFGIPPVMDKERVLRAIEQAIREKKLSNSEAIAIFAKAFYKEPLETAKARLIAQGRDFPSVFAEYTNSI